MKNVSASIYFAKTYKLWTKGEDIFNVVNENILLFKLHWKICVSVCTDGCPSAQRSRKGFVTFVLQENPNVLVVRCMIDREALIFRSIPEDQMFVLDQVITLVNFIKSRPLASRLLSQFCEGFTGTANAFCIIPTFVGSQGYFSNAIFCNWV